MNASDVVLFLLFFHRPFVSPGPLAIAEHLTFQFYCPAKTRDRGVRFVVTSLLKAPAPQRLIMMWNNSWECSNENK